MIYLFQLARVKPSLKAIISDQHRPQSNELTKGPMSNLALSFVGGVHVSEERSLA